MSRPAELGLVQQAAAHFGLSLSQEQAEQLLSYLDLLSKWNKAFSLTAISKREDMLIYHLLDGLSVVSYFAKHPTILDVGSGMGVPGVILAICYPEHTVVAIDSNSKKSAFLTQVKIELGLTNFSVVSQRVEAFQPREQFSAITSRAFANLALFIELTEHLLAADGCYLAMKSSQGLREQAGLSAWHCQTYQLQVPQLAALRFLIKMVPA